MIPIVRCKATPGVLHEVEFERHRQEATWGEQNLPAAEYFMILAEEVGEVAMAINEKKLGTVNASDVREELIQVAAVAVAMVESLDRNGR